MAVVCKRDTELIPGYRLTSQLGKGAFGEVWKCQAPGGVPKAIKLVGNRVESGCQNEAIDLERRALDRIKAIRHPFLLALDRVEVLDGELVVVMELADRSLRHVLKAYQADGKAGIPRNDLLCYLRETAEVLDLMNFEHGLQHLDVKPDNLFLVGNHVKVADFGLVATHVEGMKPLSLAIPFSAPYTAPERFQGSVSVTSDQYSLAIVYHELLTGRRPFDGKNANKLLFQHQNEPPDLSALPDDDRSVVAKALAKNPNDRFGSCTAFIEALSDDPVVVNAGVEPTPPTVPREAGDSEQAVDEFLNQVRGRVETRTHGWIRYTVHPDDRVEHMCFVSALDTATSANLERFRQKWNARAILREYPRRLVYQVLQRSDPNADDFGPPPELVMHLNFPQPRRDQPHAALSVTIRATGSDARRRRRHLLEAAPRLLESLHEFLQPYPDMRSETRVATDQHLEVLPHLPDSRVGPVLAGRALDVTAGGMRLWLPSRPPTRVLRIQLPTANPNETVSILAEIRRVGAGEDGGYEVGVQFRGGDPILAAAQAESPRK